MSGEISDTELAWEPLGSTYDDNAGLILFRKRLDRLRNPRNQKVFERIVLESVDWVNVVALDTAGRSVMVRQYRFGTSSITLETPGGMVDPGESPLAAAKRELLEETGYTGERWTSLGAVEPNPAIHNNLCHHFLVEDVQRVGADDAKANDAKADDAKEGDAQVAAGQDLGEGEHIQVVELTPDEILQAVASGEIRHVLALSALCRVFNLWPARR